MGIGNWTNLEVQIHLKEALAWKWKSSLQGGMLKLTAPEVKSL